MPLTDIWSGYSLLQSLWKIPQLVGELADRGFQSALLADFETLAGTEEFDRRMRQAGLFPLIGVSRLWYVAGTPHEVRLVADGVDAWPDLVRWANFDNAVPSAATLVLSASPKLWWDSLNLESGSSVVVELLESQQSWISQMPEGWRWAPACRVRYAAPEDRPAYELLARIGGLSADAGAKPLPPDPDAWLAPFADWPQQKLWQPPEAPSIFERHVWKMPHVPGVEDEAQVLRETARMGLAGRYGDQPPRLAQQRLDYELDVIGQLGFCGYFVMVADVVAWAKRQGIRVGPGRGSAAGSLVSYCLAITDVDPLRYGLVFERFLNPARHTLPDIDLDFEDTRRGEVIQYLRQRHGTDHVAQVGTYGTLGARAVLRDVARAMGLAGDRVTAVLKSVEWGIGDALSQHVEALKQVSGRLRLGNDWIDMAMRLEGLPRHRSTHAAGVIISPRSLGESLYCHGVAEAGWTTDFEMSSLEQLGFVKLDVLGLKTLSTLVRLEQRLGLEPEFAAAVPGRDGKTLKLLGRGDTDGIFQLDGRGVKTLLRQMRPQSREEIMLVVALYRPGPMDAIGELLKRRAAHYQPSPDDPLESLLTDTYGIMVYQEQLMSAVQRVAGFTLAEADLMRRAISKKDHDLLEREGERLIANMKERGYSRDVAAAFWDRIRAFGDYGFNKSHAASYGLISYYLAYLKAHHPVRFWAEELSSHENGERLRELMTQAVSQGLVIHPPHVNDSGVGFEVADDEIVAGLSIVRGLGADTAAKIVLTRQSGGPFINVADFSRRIGKVPQSRLLELLESAGALQGLGPVAGAASAQMSLFEPASPHTEGVPNWAEAFGFGWPRADGPIYVRLDPGAEMASVAGRIQQLADRIPGTTPVALIAQTAKAHPLPEVAVGHDWRAIEAIKEVEGVQAAGRHVTL